MTSARTLKHQQYRSRYPCQAMSDNAERGRKAMIETKVGSFGPESRRRITPAVDTLMIEPPAPAFIRVPNSAASRNGPFALTACVLSYSASVTDARSGYSGDIPALLTRTWQAPNSR